MEFKNLWKVTTVDIEDEQRSTFFMVTSAESISGLMQMRHADCPWPFRIEQAEYLGQVRVYP